VYGLLQEKHGVLKRVMTHPYFSILSVVFILTTGKLRGCIFNCWFICKTKICCFIFRAICAAFETS